MGIIKANIPNCWKRRNGKVFPGVYAPMTTSVTLNNEKIGEIVDNVENEITMKISNDVLSELKKYKKVSFSIRAI